MRKNLALIMIAVGLLGLSACDSREDWFDKNAPRPDLVVTIGDKVDTLTGSDSRVIEVDLHMVRSDEWGDLYTDTINIHFNGISDGRGFPISQILPFYNVEPGGASASLGSHYEKGDGYDIYCKADYPLTSYYEVHKELDCSILARLSQFDFVSDTSARVESFTSTFVVTDVFEGEYYYTIKVNIIGDIAPTPILKVKRLDYNYEYSLSLEDSYDRDGKVSKYEWCIDGNIVPYDVKDFRYESKDGAWQSGQAAYGGKYVKATTINSINHNFQSPGEHTVYYRCMDNLGAWSMWYSQTINVEE